MTFFRGFIIVVARGDVVDSVVARLRNGSSYFRDLLPLLPGRSLSLGVIGRLCSTCL